MPASDSLVDEAIAAHGGSERWAQVKQLKIHVRIRGNIFALKLASRRLHEIDVTVDTHRVHAALRPFPSPGLYGEFDADRVIIRDDGGRTISERQSARAPDGTVARRVRWSALDVLYFLGYALWNYSVTPYLFRWPDFECSRGPDWKESTGVTWRTLRVRYPIGFPTHSRDQTFYFDSAGLLCRLDYTADVFSSIARGAHLCEEPRTFDGLVFPTHRIVYPRWFGNRPLRVVSVMEGWVDRVTVL